jgi:hypothetical protein
VAQAEDDYGKFLKMFHVKHLALGGAQRFRPDNSPAVKVEVYAAAIGDLIVSHILGGWAQKLFGPLGAKGFKSEYRNSKFETNSNSKCSKFETSDPKKQVSVICDSNFCHCFGFRHSNFGFHAIIAGLRILHASLQQPHLWIKIRSGMKAIQATS